MTSVHRDPDHGSWQDDAAAYVLRALDDEELRRFERHLAGCQRCREDVEAMRRTTDALPAPAALVPPRALKQRVMTAVRAEAGQAQDRAPARSQALRAAAAAEPRVGCGGRGGVVVVVVIGVFVVQVSSPVRTYAGKVFAPGASASLRVSGQPAQLRFSRLPAPPPGRLYEVWLSRGGQVPTPTRALFASSSGSVALAGNFSGVRAVLVTAEPEPNGSRAPTRAPIIVVRLARS